MKHSLTLFLIVITLVAFSQPSPSWQWARTGTCTTSDTGSSITTDNTGNIYTTGYFFGSNLTFNSTTLSNAGNYDAYIVKHDFSGNFMWATAIGGAFDDVATSIVCDNVGNVFVTGYYTSSTLAIGAFTLTNLGGTDVFVVKYNPFGSVMWAKSFGDNMIEEPFGIASDGNNIFVTGQFQSNTITFGTSTLTCNGNGDVFTTKYDNNGNELWARGFGDVGLEIGYDIAVTPSNDIFVTGSFRSPNLTFSTYTLTNMGNSDYFLIRYDGSGNEIWAKGAGGNFDDSGTSIKENGGSIYTTGYFKSTNISLGAITYTNASPTNADVFVVNYNNLGTETWSRAFGGNLDDIPYGIASVGGYVFIGGHIHSSSVAFDTYTLTCGGVGDGFIAKLDYFGTVIWAENEGGLNDDGINDITSDQFSYVYAAGYYNSSSISFSSFTLNNNGSSDIFVSKLFSPPSGVTEIANFAQNISLYPNPASTGFTIGNLPSNSIVKIFDMSGKELKHYEANNTMNTFIEVKELQEGLYIVNILSENSVRSLKLSVLH